MKKQKNIFAIALSMTLLMGAPVYAYDGNTTLNHAVISIPQTNVYRVDFQNGIAINSEDNKANLDIIGNNLQEVVYSVNTGVDTFTLGYYLGDDDYSYELMMTKLQESVNNLNYDINNEPKLAGNHEFQIQDLNVAYIQLVESENFVTVRSNEVSENKNIETLIKDLVGVTEYRNINNPYLEANLTDCATVEHVNSSRSRYSIDGSEHYIESVLGEMQLYWYDQLTDEGIPCYQSLTSPHAGDGNNRYESGYAWYPDDIEVNFFVDYNDEIGVNRTCLWYRYDSDTLANLVHDDDEALEVEVVFYDFNSFWHDEDDRGNAFMTHDSSMTWSTNQPSNAVYRDTTVADDSNSVSFCIGVDDASLLDSGRWYYWAMNGEKGDTSDDYPHDGRFKVIAQRSYNLLSGGTWSVFAEEHEGIRTLGVEEDYNWVVPSAWDLAWIGDVEGETWEFDASTDRVE